MKNKFISLVFLFNCIYASGILEAQIDAIMKISANNGYSQEELNSIIREYGVYSLPELSQSQAAEIINRIQNNHSTQIIQTTTFEPILADILEVGMSKYFYLIDGNRIRGEIIKIVDQICHIKTAEGTLEIPMTDILEETIDLTKIDDTRYKGPLIREDEEKLILRSKYGDVTILKKEVEKMERFHGGKLVPEVESRKTFYQGEDELIGVFFDHNAFVLDPNTFFLSGMSLGYGFTDRFMITTKYGSNFGGDLNLHPKLRVWHKKTSNNEKALSIGLGIHRAHPIRSIISKYSHAFYMNNDLDSTLNNLSWDESTSFEDCEISNCYNINDFVSDDDTQLLLEGYIVYSSKRKNPTGRGKVGWSVGFKTSNMLANLNDFYISPNDDTINWNKDDFSFPYRLFSTFEYDLQKRIKVVASMWMDNSNRTVTAEDAIADYFGEIGSPFAFDALIGKHKSQFDFDFGFMFTMNENFRVGIHFQQPYIDFHWEFFEF